MIGLYVCLGVEHTQRFTYRGPRVRIGSAADNDLILRDGNVPEYAFTIEQRDGVCFQDDRPIADGAELEAGDYMLILALTERTWRRLDVTDEVERRLIDSIVARDDASRLVYADWLEERGQFRRAEFLRMQEALTTASRDEAAFGDDALRLRLLATLIDVSWRHRIGQPRIEGCRADACPEHWSGLTETGDPKLRTCEICKQPVLYCTRIDEARYQVGRGRRVVIDATVLRTPRDLS